MVVDDGQGDLGLAWIEGVVHRTIMAGVRTRLVAWNRPLRRR